MLNLLSNNLTTFISYYTILITLVLTPLSNKDAMIVPKVVLLIILFFLVFPIFLSNIRRSLNTQKKFKVFGPFFLFTILLVSILISSSSPIEQQLFGRGGRGLGLFTILTTCLILVIVSTYGESNSQAITKGLVVSAFVSSSYALLQSYGIDFYEWETRTNGIVGTLGNPNFQASFAAMATLPTIVFFWKKKDLKNVLILIFILIFYVNVLLRNNSTQGYIGLIISLIFFFLTYIWYKNKLVFWIACTFSSFIGFLAIIGMIGKGPLSDFLYKISIQSRGDFWRSAFETAQNNPLLGIGIDSFGDYFLKYRDEITISHPWAEFTDNAHNYYLEFAATGGFLFAMMFIVLQIFTAYCVFSFLKSQKSFNSRFSVMASAYFVYLAQSVISPGNIAIMLWGSIISGWIIFKRVNLNTNIANSKEKYILKPLTKISVALSLIVGLTLSYPYFRADQLQLTAMKTGNGDLAIKSAKMFPESTTRYATIIRGLYDSNLYDSALELSRHAVEFNPQSANLWAFILINPNAPIVEREKARLKIVSLDPLNLQARNFKLQS